MELGRSEYEKRLRVYACARMRPGVMDALLSAAPARSCGATATPSSSERLVSLRTACARYDLT